MRSHISVVHNPKILSVNLLILSLYHSQHSLGFSRGLYALLSSSHGFKSLVTQTPRSFSTDVDSNCIILLPSSIVQTVGKSWPMCITVHFSGLKVNNHVFDHSPNLSRSRCSDSWSSSLWILVQTFVSSANIMILFLTQSGRSRTNIKNSSGLM